MEFDLKGRVAFVTGATSGLGRHFATVLAKAGAAVAISGRRAERLAELRKEIATGGKCAEIVLDVTDARQIAPALDKAEAMLGPVDILVNNAGMSANGPVADIATADFDAVMATNLRAPFLLAQDVGRRMIARGKGGRIINIASITAFRVLQGSAPYCISKAGLAMMTQCMAREWARYDINVNAICPGFIETELNDAWFESAKGKAQIQSFPKRRLQRPDDLDSTLLLLASDASRAITGALFNVDEAQSL
ncbi:MAG TPA: SDR family NAD(P)-dependent oxidoreductase [Rhizomicrobium sp.]|jgi:NAD(P)-dependent dehydrogenase (short-subunit alcohol dehydrogenase family)